MGKDLYYDGDQLNEVAKTFSDAATKFSGTVDDFRGNEAPSFGLFFQWLSPMYQTAKEQTVNYVDDMSAIFGAMSSKVEDAVRTMDELEQNNKDRLDKISSRIDDVDTTLNQHTTSYGGDDGGDGGSDGVDDTKPEPIVEPHVPTGGGSGGNGGDGGNGGNGGSGTTYQPVQPVEQTDGSDRDRYVRSDDDDEPMPGDIGYQEPSTDSRGDDTGDKSADDGNDDRIDVDSSSTPSTDGMIDVDLDGDGTVDYGIRMEDGTNLDATITDTDGKRQMGLTPERSQWGTVRQDGKTGDFNIDADGDGTTDATLHVDDGQQAGLTFGDDAQGRYVSVDFDHDGDADFTYRVPGDTPPEFGHTQAERQALDEAWEQIAANDPLGRTAEELRRQFEERDVISWDDEDGDLEYGTNTFAGAQPASTAYTTTKAGESWIRS